MGYDISLPPVVLECLDSICDSAVRWAVGYDISLSTVILECLDSIALEFTDSADLKFVRCYDLAIRTMALECLDLIALESSEYSHPLATCLP